MSIQRLQSLRTKEYWKFVVEIFALMWGPVWNVVI